MVSESVSGPWVEVVSPPSRWQPKRCWSTISPAAKRRSQASVDALGPGQHRQIAQRIGTHRGEVGQVDAQELARDQVGRVVGQEVDVGDDRVLGDHQLLPGRDIDQGRVVGQAERTRIALRQRLEHPFDQLELAQAHASGVAVLRVWARRSSTALTKDGSPESKNR